MSEHESREALRERIAQAVAAHVWAGVAWDHRETDRDGFRRCADRILAILPVAPVVGEREALVLTDRQFWMLEQMHNLPMDDEMYAVWKILWNHHAAARTPEEHG